jgi:hypothetical protein
VGTVGEKEDGFISRLLTVETGIGYESGFLGSK